MGKGKTAQRAARAGAMKATGPVYQTVKILEMYKKPSGNWGCRTRWEKRVKE